MSLLTVSSISTFPGLDHRSRGLRCVLLSRRVFVPAERAHERNKPRYRTDTGALDEPNDGPKAVLRSNQTVSNLGALLRRQFECDPQEIPKYGRSCLWMPLGGAPCVFCV